MSEPIIFELVFALPSERHDTYELSDAIFAAGYDDAVIGSGAPRLLGVEIETNGENAESTILEAGRAILERLPTGTVLHEVRPDLVSLADVAEKLNVKRQALQQRAMPLPVAGGLYRIDDIQKTLQAAAAPQPGQRRPRFDVQVIRPWFKAGHAARRINAKLALHEIDPATLEQMPAPLAL